MSSAWNSHPECNEFRQYSQVGLVIVLDCKPTESQQVTRRVFQQVGELLPNRVSQHSILLS
ncbi:MAG: hypothetical protein IGS50_12045 [Synechococcales cyanobacterium C42_A2020_086]|jgi:hypothetical protein|nr:hypothetical protein [Synechococcales cyanobacterium M58_A2018_015]MBF2074476.1 hypothetical protein [Synechococcales cyanobacterium C42_A2020_086]